MLSISELKREVIENLPATRQRHSLFTLGRNLLDLPDDPKDVAVYNSSKKRNEPEGGFSRQNNLIHLSKFPRANSEGNIQALNLVKKPTTSNESDSQAQVIH